MSDTGSQGQASGGRKISSNIGPVSSSLNPNRPAGNIIKGPVDDNGKLEDAALLLGIKLDLEAEINDGSDPRRRNNWVVLSMGSCAIRIIFSSNRVDDEDSSGHYMNLNGYRSSQNKVFNHL